MGGASSSGEPSGFAALYTSGDVVLRNPIESCTIFIFVIVVSASLEVCLHLVKHSKNKYLQSILGALLKEVMIIGLLSLIVLFSTTIFHPPDRWMMIFNWIHMSLFFMAIFFSIIILCSVLSTRIFVQIWKYYERDLFKDEIIGTGDKARYLRAARRYRNTLDLLNLADENIGAPSFADYLGKRIRGDAVEITKVGWKTWLSLMIIIIFNTARAKIVFPTKHIETDNVSTVHYIIYIYSFIGLCGFGVLLLFAGFVWILGRRLDSYLNQIPPEHEQKSTTASTKERKEILKYCEDPTVYLLRGSKNLTLEIIRIISFFFQWYLSLLTLGMGYNITERFSSIDTFPLMSTITILCALLPVLIFLCLLPKSLFYITSLSSLGSKFDIRSVEHTFQCETHGSEASASDSDSSSGSSESEKSEESTDAENQLVDQGAESPEDLFYSLKPKYVLREK